MTKMFDQARIANEIVDNMWGLFEDVARTFPETAIHLMQRGNSRYYSSEMFHPSFNGVLCLEKEISDPEAYFSITFNYFLPKTQVIKELNVSPFGAHSPYAGQSAP